MDGLNQRFFISVGLLDGDYCILFHCCTHRLSLESKTFLNIVSMKKPPDCKMLRDWGWVSLLHFIITAATQLSQAFSLSPLLRVDISFFKTYIFHSKAKFCWQRLFMLENCVSHWHENQRMLTTCYVCFTWQKSMSLMREDWLIHISNPLSLTRIYRKCMLSLGGNRGNNDQNDSSHRSLL